MSSTACYDNVQLAVSYTVEVEVLKNNAFCAVRAYITSSELKSTVTLATRGVV